MKAIRVLTLSVVALTLVSCSKEDENGSDTQPPVIQRPPDWNAQFIIGGQAKSWTSDGITWAAGDSRYSYRDGQSMWHTVITTSMESVTTPERLSVHRGELITTGSEPASYAQRKTFYQPGACSFSDSAWSIPGVIVSYVDSAGVEWTSARGPQNGSSFQITGGRQYQVYNILIWGFTTSFTCYVYDGAGHSRHITSASTRMSIDNTQ